MRRIARRLALATSVAATVSSLLQRRRAKDAAEIRPVRSPEWPPLER